MKAEEKFDKSFRWTLLYLRLSGINLQQSHVNILSRWLFFFSVTWVQVEVLGEFCWVIDGFSKGKGFEELSEIAPIFTVGIFGTVKAAPLYFQKKTVINVIEKLREIHPETEDDKKETKNDEEITESETAIKLERKIARDTIKKYDTLIMILIFLLIQTALIFNFSPIAVMGYKLITTGTTEIILPFAVKYFYDFDLYKPTIWPWVYIRQVMCPFIVIFQIIGSDTLFYGCCEFIQMHFRILACRIEYMIGNDYEEDHKTSVTLKLKDYIRRHQELTELVVQLEQLYSYSSLFNFVTSSFMICLSGFIITISNDTFLRFRFITFLVMTLSQVAIICYGGELISRSSEDISEAIYRSRWYSVDAGLKRSMLIILTRAQRPCKLTAGKFADLDLIAFSTVMKRSWSLFALLSTVYD